MAKRLFLVLVICLCGIFANPTVLMASDNFVAKLPDFRAVKTELTETPASSTPDQDSPTPVNTAAPTVLPHVPAAAVAPNPTLNYQVTHLVGSAAEFTSIAESLSYSDIYRYKKLVYGHNTANLLGNLSSLTPGQIFTITENGAVTTYRVATSIIYQNASPSLIDGSGNAVSMSKIANSALGHSLALMTCAGTPYGNGNATHRLIVFADAI